MAQQDFPPIDLYTGPTPNGYKLSITLEELGWAKSLTFSPLLTTDQSLNYNVHGIEVTNTTQKEPWFLKINPNGRIPALIDTLTDGTSIKVWETGSMMQYLVDRYDRDHRISYPKGTFESYQVNNWLFFQNAGIGPMQGQATHFTRFAPEGNQYSCDRYRNEVRRLYRVLELQIASSKSGWLVGDRCTIADLAHWGWAVTMVWAGIDVDEFPNIKAWVDRMSARPAVQRGCNVPSPFHWKDVQSDEEKMRALAKAGRSWVLKRMEVEARQ